MKKSLIILIIIALVAVVGFVLYQNNSQGISVQIEPSATQRNIKQPGVTTTANQEKTEYSDNYIEYSPEAIKVAASQGKKIVLFFHANWCSTCINAHKDFLKRTAEIPDGIVVVKTDYDTQKDLKKKYNVTYQHTFVQVDGNNELVTIWNGGDLDEVLKNIK
jgi:thiol-disulfide isomerase/thioredoxin